MSDETAKPIEFVLRKENLDYLKKTFTESVTGLAWAGWLDALWAEYEELYLFKENARAVIPTGVIEEIRKHLDGLTHTVVKQANHHAGATAELRKELHNEVKMIRDQMQEFSDGLVIEASTERAGRIESNRNLHARITDLHEVVKIDRKIRVSRDVELEQQIESLRDLVKRNKNAEYGLSGCDGQATAEGQAIRKLNLAPCPGGVWAPIGDLKPRDHASIFTDGFEYIAPRHVQMYGRANRCKLSPLDAIHIGGRVGPDGYEDGWLIKLENGKELLVEDGLRFTNDTGVVYKLRKEKGNWNWGCSFDDGSTYAKNHLKHEFVINCFVKGLWKAI